MKDFQTEIDAAMADPVRRARIEQYGREIDMILALAALREAVGMTQEDFASAASMSQENVSRIERATDVKLSTIRRLARTAGAQLELNAVFPNGKKVSLFRPATGLSVKSSDEIEFVPRGDELVVEVRPRRGSRRPG